MIELSDYYLESNIIEEKIVIPVLPCPKCPNRYRHINHLRRHIQYECQKEPQLTCAYCNSKFKRPDSLRRHIQQSCRNKFVRYDTMESSKIEPNSDHSTNYKYL